MTRIDRLCPVCNKPLFAERVTPCGIAVFCGYGPCPSHATNLGGEGATEKEAYDVLCRKVENELVQNDYNDCE